MPLEIRSGRSSLPSFTNEDRFVVNEEHDDWKVYAVLDGHGGKTAATMISHQISEILLRCVRETEQQYDEDPDSFEKEVKKRIQNEYERLDDKVMTACDDCSGACITAAIVSGLEPFYFIVHLGDCRVLLIDSESSLAFKSLTKDHQVSNPHERARILRTGHSPENGRVCGLEPTRTLGDFDVKAQAEDAVSCVPEVFLFSHHEPSDDPAIDLKKKRRAARKRTSEKRHVLLLLATDGVWGFANNNSAATTAHRSLFQKSTSNPILAASAVTKLAKDMGSTDDITTIAVCLEW